MGTAGTPVQEVQEQKVNPLLSTRDEMLEAGREKVNAHFRTEHKTQTEIMADPRTSAAMIGFMICWDWITK